MVLNSLLFDLPSIGVTLGIALLGASALWGFIFTYKSRHGDKTGVWRTFGVEMFGITFFGLLFLLVGYWANTSILKIALKSQPNLNRVIEFGERADLYNVQFPMVIALLFVFVLGMIFIKKSSKQFLSNLERFYLALFVTTLVISFADLFNSFSLNGLLQSLQNLSHIFIFGTIAVLGHLYVRSRKNLTFTKQLFPFLPIIAKVVWFGVGLQVLNILLNSSHGVILNDEFAFYQILLGLFVFVGAILGGPVLTRLEKTQKINQKIDFIVLTFGAAATMISLLLILIEMFDLFRWNLEQLVLVLVVSIILALFGVLVAEYDN